MDKIQALHRQELQDELRFKETMAQRDRIFKMKSEIETMERQTQKVQQEMKLMEPEHCQTEIDVKMLTNQIEEITKNIRDKLKKVLRQENKLKQSKESLQKFLKDQLEKSQPILKQIRQKENSNAATLSTLQENEEIAQTNRKIWALQGEIEALKLIDEYQKRKIEEIKIIIDVVQEQSDLPNVTSLFFKD